MKYVTTTNQRNRRFAKAYRDAAVSRPGRSVESLLDEVISKPVPRGFFVSVDHVIVMDRLRREGKLPKMSAERTDMWTELFRQFDEYLAIHAGATRVEAACAVISGGTAPRFYIRRSVARSLITNNI